MTFIPKLKQKSGRVFSALVLLIVLPSTWNFSPAQRIFFEEDFSNNPFGTAGWTTQSINDQGPSAPPGAALWTWSQDGRASQGAYWEGRPPIGSTSGGGAALFDSDFLDNAGTPGNSCGTGASSCVPHEGLLISPQIPINLGSLHPDSAIGLVFNQYFRGFQSQTLVEISTNGGNNWMPIPVNQDLSGRPFGGETTNNDLQILNLMPYLPPGTNNFRFRFHFMGEYYFWLIDNVKVQAIPLDDIALTQMVYPPQQDYCYFGSEELIKVEICNQGAMPQDSFFVTLEIGKQRGVEFINLPLVAPLQPNECAIVAIDTLVDLTDFIFLNIFLETQQDLNPQNNQLNKGNSYQICHDSLGGPFVCTHAIIRFRPGTPPPVKDSIRNKFGASRLKTCACDSLELWDVPYPIILPLGPPIFDPEEAIKKMVEEPDVEEGGLNYIMDFASMTPTALGSYSQSVRASSSLSTKIGVIDTGLDFLHDSIQERFWENAEELADPYGTDNDNNCVAQDNWGINLIESDRIPLDDHIRGHGTHIGGIMLKDLPTGYDLELITIKAMGQNGRGGLFELLCGSQYAINEGASVVNMSMGYTGVRSQVLDSMMSRLQKADVLVVSSAGNDTLDNDNPETPHWPSNFALDYNNILSVAALDAADSALNPFSNYGSQAVNIAAPGTEIYSLLPGNGFGPKDGTSMAAAIVTRAAGLFRAQCPSGDAAFVIDRILAVADTLATLSGKVREGKSLNLDDNFYTDIICEVAVSEKPRAEDIKYYPNPFDEEIILEIILDSPEKLNIEVFDLWGKKVMAKRINAQTGMNKITLPTEMLQSGIYVYELSGDKGSRASAKWIKR